MNLSELKENIDRKHQEALRALEVLKEYLANSQPAQKDQDNNYLVQTRAPVGKTTYRDQVLQMLKTGWITVRGIKNLTGLDEKRIRGVLYSPSLKSTIDKRMEGEEMEYKLRNG